MSRNKKATIKDVALHANVSVGTVSRVLAMNKTVKMAIQNKVRQSIDQLGYKPNLAARALRAQKVDVLGLIVPDITNPFFAQIANEVELEATKHGLAVIFSSSHNDDEKEAQQFSAILNHAPTGIIFIPVSSGSLLSKLHNVPVITVDRPCEGYDGVFADQAHGAMLGANYIFELGHRNVAYISGPADTANGQQRQKGFCERFKLLCKNEPEFTLDIYHGTYDFASGEEIARKILTQPNIKPPTAIVAASDPQAIGALREARDLGIDVPNQLSIIGFDDITLANVVAPRLTTIRQPIKAIAVEAVSRIMGHKKGNLTESFPCELIIRTSSAAPSK